MKVVLICIYAGAILAFLSMDCLYGDETDSKNVSARFYRGFKRAPLPFPYQLVKFGDEIILCNYEGEISAEDVVIVGYDSEYIYAFDVKGCVVVLHLYDEYEEKYDNDKSLPESIRSRICSGVVKMLDTQKMVDDYSSQCVPLDNCFYRRDEVVKERHWRSCAESSFLPEDITIVTEYHTNSVPRRIVRSFQNCALSMALITRIKADNLLGMGVYWRKISNSDGRFGEWTELGAMTYPIMIKNGEEFEICIEYSVKELRQNGKERYTSFVDCPTVKIIEHNGGCATIRIMFKDIHMGERYDTDEVKTRWSWSVPLGIFADPSP